MDTTERYGLRTQYNRDFSPDWFGFGSGETLRDKLANIAARYSVASGVGRHVWAEERGYFDVSMGLGYTHDRYVRSTDIAGAMCDRYGSDSGTNLKKGDAMFVTGVSIRID